MFEIFYEKMKQAVIESINQLVHNNTDKIVDVLISKIHPHVEGYFDSQLKMAKNSIVDEFSKNKYVKSIARTDNALANLDRIKDQLGEIARLREELGSIIGSNASDIFSVKELSKKIMRDVNKEKIKQTSQYNSFMVEVQNIRSDVQGVRSDLDKMSDRLFRKIKSSK